MALQEGDFNISTNVTLRKKGTWDSRQYVDSYTDLFLFTEEHKIPYGFPVACGGQDDFSKLGIWQCVNPNDLSNPLSWVRGNEPIPFNQVIQIGSYSFDDVTFIAALGETLDWVFNEEGINISVGDTDVVMTAPDETLPRVDIISWNSIDGYVVTEGTPSNNPAVPNTPIGDIFVRQILRNIDGTTESPEPPDLSGYAKLNGGNTFSGDQTITNGKLEIRRKGFAAQLNFAQEDGTQLGYIAAAINAISGNRYLGIGGGGYTVATIDLITRIMNFTATPTVNGVQIGAGGASNFADLGGNARDNASLLSEIEALESADEQIIDDAPTAYNTLKKIATKLAAIEAIIDEGGEDADSIVNTVAELLAVFETYPEGADIATLLAGKINTADIVNNLSQVVAGKVLDAAQGKELNDLITATADYKLDRGFTNMSGRTSGSSSAYLLNLIGLPSYISMSIVSITFHTNCAANPTLNVNGLGAKPLKYVDNTNIGAGQLIFDQSYILVYNSTYEAFIVVGILPLSSYDSRYIVKTTGSQNGSFNLLGTGQATRLGAGATPSAASKLTIATGSATETQTILPPRTNENNYAGTIQGAIDNIEGVIKFRDATAQTDLLKKDRNPSLSGETVAKALIQIDGSITREIVPDSDVISAITAATYVDGYAVIIPSGGKVFYQGSEYFDDSSKYWYRAVSDNKVIRVIPS